MKTAIERVRSCLRVSDIVLELDDGQVGVILVDLFDAQVSQQILGRISEAFNSAMRFRDEMFQLKLKVGMAFPEQGENQAEALLAAAQGSLNRQEVSKELAGEMI
jgi:GGDEF domain-containing protein